MRPSSQRLVTLWIIALCLLATFTLDGRASAASKSSSKRRLSTRVSTSARIAQRNAPPPPLTGDSWTGASGGSWNTSTNWSAGVPTSSNAVTINTAATVVNLNTGAAGAAGSLTLGSGDTLNVSGETLTDSGALTNAGTLNLGTSSGGATVTIGGATSNTGTIAIANNSFVTVDGNISGAGAITLNSSGNFSQLILGGNVTLSGGTLTMSNNANNFILGANALNQLTNQETIQGAGQIGDGQMALVNSGTINANASAGMTINANDGFTNTGTVEATGGNTLTLQNMGSVVNTGGTISANASTVNINNTSIQGGTLSITGTGAVNFNGSNFVGGTLTNSATGVINIASGVNVLSGTINNSAGGLFEISNNAFLDLGAGTYSQLGKVQLNSSGNFSQLILEGNVTLSGGSVTMSNNANNFIFGQSTNDTLTNQETISGAGQLGGSNGTLTLVNSGTINANQSAGMTINAHGGVTNTGTIEATGTATLLIQSNINNTGGTISANTGTLNLSGAIVNGGNITLTGASSLLLNTATIQNGSTITNSATGTINVQSGLNVLGGTINNSAGGTFEISNNAFLDLQAGTYSQLGNLQLNSTGNFSQLILQGNTTLSGGSVTMSNNVNNFIFGQSTNDTLTNQETISGAGQLGGSNGTLTLVNSGTINANQSAGMTINAHGGTSNTGTIEATAGATLLIQSNINNTGGTISANTGTLNVSGATVSGGSITLSGGSTLLLNTANLVAGTITNSSTGTINIASGVDVLHGMTINNSAGGTFEISNNAFLELSHGTYAQLGNVQINSSGNFSQLILEGDVTLSGGSVTMSNNINNFIFGGTTPDTLTNQETISGAGQLGGSNGTLTLVNSATINSNQSAGIIIDALGGVTNTGTMEATGGSTLTIQNTTVNNTGGTISANTSIIDLTNATVGGGNITLSGASSLNLNGATVHGGTITNSSTGTIQIIGTDTLGGTINNSAGGVFEIDNNAFLTLEPGTYSQLGNVQLNSSGNFSQLILGGNVTLSGGSVTMSNNINNFIFGQIVGDTLTNQETISGAGQIGGSNGTLTLVNTGTINSNQTAGMIIDAVGGVTNTGTLEATNGVALTLQNSAVNNAGGTISANTGTINVTNATVTGGTISLTGASALNLSGATVHGGTIINSSTGTIQIIGTDTLGGTINNSTGGTLAIGNNAFLTLEGGTYAKLGNVTLNSTGNFSQLILGGNVTLSGTTVTMSANANNFILGQVSSDVLTNQGTIQGAGQIGSGSNTLGLVNSGSIIANASGNMVIDVSNLGLNNTGTLEASGATLTLEGPGVTFLTNDNQSTGTLTGGTYIANGSNIQWNAGTNNITTLAAKVTEQGGGELFNTCTATGCNSNMLAGLTSITSAGSLTIGGLAFTDAGAFSNAGSLTLLSGESFTVGSLNQISGGSLTAGTYVLNANLNLSGTAQTITTNAATLTLAGGTIENTSNSTNALAGLATNTGKLTIGGGSNNVSTTASSFSNTGTLTINAGDSFTAAKLTQISGTTLSGGTYVLGGNLNLTTAGISITKNSATLTLQGGTINSNGVNALSALASSTRNLTLANSANLTTSTSGNFSNSGTVTVNTGSTLTVGGSHSYSQTAGTTTVDGTLTGASITATGGTVQGAGTLKGNTSIGNATGTAVTMNVGDSGKSGLLAITGTYTQLATGNLTGLINGTTAGTGFSQVNISGSASLGGTINFTVATAFQASLTLGEAFTVLNASAVTGTFTNSTIAINSSFHFTVTYTSTGVVLTVASGPVGASGSSSAPATALASAKPATITAHASSKAPIAVSGSHAASGAIKAGRVAVASWDKPVQGSGATVARRSNLIGEARIWAPARTVSSSPARATTTAAAAPSRPLAVVPARATVPTSTSYLRTGQNQSIGVQSQRTPWNAAAQNRPVPVKAMSPLLPRVGR